ncbi:MULTISPECIES: SPOR domain-containing protein [unclassified Pseudoalteromonas]|uniref:SPOR domain-containing protein n=1 Tax=unclassified Pseudoalteromonas TaxID=194690 RepID=UPI00209854F2|nr:SPOR domain-containing protein [Pseudoalteromonas sp. XMcav2-N]MCO7190909.1 SPOR domain-containing protein [Pseudoalteromonas sp. XMcav2-N]
MKLYSYLVWPLLVVLSGCASTGQDEQRLAQLEQQLAQLHTDVEQIKRSVEQWQQVAPQVSELLSIEQELNLLTTQLQLALAPATQPSGDVMVAKVAKSPDIVEQPQSNHGGLAVQSAPGENKEATKATRDVKPKLPAKTDKAEFAVQLASTRKQSQLKTVHQRLIKSYPPLQEQPVNVEQVEIRGQRYFRLKLGAFENKTQGQALCDKLKPFHPQCLLSHYTDNPITL